MKSITKTNKGITLIALVITIIILLILAGISIATLTGENGVLTKANNAKVETVHATVKESIALKKSNYEMEKVVGEYKGNFIEYLEKETIIQDKEEETYKINVTNLIGEKQTLGNGTGLKDVYKLEKIVGTEKYVVNYYDNNEAKTEIIELNIGQKEEINKKPEQMESTEIYAKVYTDKTTIFSSYDYVDSSHGEVKTTYTTDELNKIYEGEPPRWLSVAASGAVAITDFMDVIIRDKIAPTVTGYWFYGISSLTGIENLVTNNVINMECMFAQSDLEELDLRNFDTSSVTSMRAMFCNDYYMSVPQRKTKEIKFNQF